MSHTIQALQCHNYTRCHMMKGQWRRIRLGLNNDLREKKNHALFVVVVVVVIRGEILLQTWQYSRHAHVSQSTPSMASTTSTRQRTLARAQDTYRTCGENAHS